VGGVETNGQDKAMAAVQALGLAKAMEVVQAPGLDRAMEMEGVLVLGPARAAEVVAVVVAMAMAGLETALMLTPSSAILSPSATSHSLQSVVTSRRSSRAMATLPAASATLAALP
jgi:hypothetical protein